MIKNHIDANKTLLIIALLAAVGQITNTIAVPAMSAIANSLLIQIHYVQWLIAVYLLPYGISQFLYGPISDKIGRRPVIITGLGIYLAGSVLTVFARQFSMLLLGTLIQGAGIGVGGVMCRTVVRDILSGKQLHRANSKMSMLLILAPLIAPLVGGLLNDHFRWRMIYIFLLVFASICLTLQIKYFAETNHGTQRQLNWKKSYNQILRCSTFRNYTALLLLSFSGVAVFEACASLLFSNVLGYSATDMSLLFIIPLPGSIIGSYISGQTLQTLLYTQYLLLSNLHHESCKCCAAWLCAAARNECCCNFMAYNWILIWIRYNFPSRNNRRINPFSYRSRLSRGNSRWITKFRSGCLYCNFQHFYANNAIAISFDFNSLMSLYVASNVCAKKTAIDSCLKNTCHRR